MQLILCIFFIPSYYTTIIILFFICLLIVDKLIYPAFKPIIKNQQTLVNTENNKIQMCY